ncbi:hypothetical protein K458DRAFT_300834 [Lentithecium fluviatile CBS 122367]|uniref:Rhodopsin domain-containing protein n=1 Tax=Lentithecium fluviatile CBS 122367 TaxID=1168545 RepID=A0A6G1J3K2_9PLEO|nr:hypothetical protein K458DRAFT_300834 [Lentithecium fluviatile CBS 122367]
MPNNSSSRPSFNPNSFRTDNDNSTTAPMLLGLGSALLFISICLLMARMWSRLRPWRLKLDDWAVLGATLLAVVQHILLGVSVFNGLGRRSRFVPFPQRRASLRLLFISQVFWYWSITFVKLSVALLLLRIKHTKRWRIFLYLIMALSVIAVIIQTCFQFLQCRPFSVYWDPRVFRMGEVRCFRRSVINGNIVAFSSVQVALDLIFSFIPITFIRKLNRPRREKIFMCVLMGLGLFASCAAIIRTTTLQGFYTSGDIFRTNVTIALWAIVELQFALIAATMPTLKSFMEKTLVRIGLFFYDEGTEEQVRGKLVQFGLLGEGEMLEKDEGAVVGRGASKGSLGEGAGTPTAKSLGAGRKVKDEFGDTVVDSEKEDVSFEDMLGGGAKAKEKEFV